MYKCLLIVWWGIFFWCVACAHVHTVCSSFLFYYKIIRDFSSSIVFTIAHTTSASHSHLLFILLAVFVSNARPAAYSFCFFCLCIPFSYLVCTVVLLFFVLFISCIVQLIKSNFNCAQISVVACSLLFHSMAYFSIHSDGRMCICKPKRGNTRAKVYRYDATLFSKFVIIVASLAEFNHLNRYSEFNLHSKTIRSAHLTIVPYVVGIG